MPEKVTSINDVQKKVNAKKPKPEATLVELAETNSIEYYTRLLDGKTVLQIQSEISSLINNSELVRVYNPLDLVMGMAAVSQDTLGSIIANSLEASVMLANPNETPEKYAELLEAAQHQITENIEKVRHKLTETLNSITEVMPMHDIMAISSIYAEALEIVVKTAKTFVEKSAKADTK